MFKCQTTRVNRHFSRKNAQIDPLYSYLNTNNVQSQSIFIMYTIKFEQN